MQTLVSTAESNFEQSLLVMPVLTTLNLATSSSAPQGLYGGVYINDTAYTSGLANTDFVIFVTARVIPSDSSSSETLAVAAVVQDDQMGRPICGHININVGGVNTALAYNQQNLGVVMHEMTHALGFTSSKIQNINPNYSPGATNLMKSVYLTVGARGATVQRTVIASPKVLAWARKFYNCETMQGMEMENQGSSGTALSHWEKRTANNEYMTGTASRNPVFSDLTLALLEDTGWYLTNNSLTGALLWGQGMGCNFASKSCDQWPRSNGYFCTSDGSGDCTADAQARGVCAVSTYKTALDSQYQYFDGQATKAGTYDLPDYCPIAWGYSNGWCFDSSQGSGAVLNTGASFGPASRCFKSSLAENLPVGQTSAALCYTSACTGPQELRVKVGSYWYMCPPGSTISVKGYGGTLSCPDRIENVCPSSSNDTTWPIFSTISPNSGGPGLNVTIYGHNFLPGISVSIDDSLINVVVVSPNMLFATIPTSDRFTRPTNLISQQESVVLTDTKGRSSVGYNAFTIKVDLDGEFFRNALQYLKDNWLITAAISAAGAVTLLCCGYCCYRQKGDASEADTDYYE